MDASTDFTEPISRFTDLGQSELGESGILMRTQVETMIGDPTYQNQEYDWDADEDIDTTNIQIL